MSSVVREDYIVSVAVGAAVAERVAVAVAAAVQDAQKAGDAVVDQVCLER